MSGSVVPAVDLESENEIDPGTETPYRGVVDQDKEMAEQGDDEAESDDDESSEMSEDEKEEERWRQRERDFFAFKAPGSEIPNDRPLVGRELLRELELHRKMRNQVLEQIKKQRDAHYMQHMMLSNSRDPTIEDLEDSELDIEDAFIPHPYPL